MSVLALVAVVLGVSWRSMPGRSAGARAAAPQAAHGLAPEAAPHSSLAVAPLQPRQWRAHLQGRVQARDGGEVAGARVCYADPVTQSAHECVISTPSGRFAFVGAPAAGAMILASAAGYLPLGRLLSESRPSASDELVLTLAEGGVVLSGSVLDATGGHIDGATVSAHPPDGGPALTFDSSSDGRFELSVPPGSLVLRARADAYSEAEVRVRAPLRGVTLVLAPAASIAGMVLSDEAREPIAGIWVTASDAGEVNVAPRRTTTDESGRFRFTGLAGGQYELRAVAAEWRTLTPSIVEAGIGEAADGVVLTAARGTTLDGVVHASDAPCASGSVELDGPVITRAAIRDGAVHFDGLRPGRYTAMVACSVGASDGRAETIGMEDSFSIDREPLSRQWTVPKTPREEGTGTIEVSVHAGDRDPLLFTVSLAAEGSSSLLRGRREDERFIFDGLTPGRYEALLDQFPEHAVPVLVTPELAHAEVSLTPPEPVLISGRVVDESQNPIPDAWVRAYHRVYRVRELAAAGIPTLTNSEGVFTVMGLLAGQYYLRVDSSLGHAVTEAVGGGITDLRIQVGARPSPPER